MQVLFRGGWTHGMWPMLQGVNYKASLWRSPYKIQCVAWKGTLPCCNHLDEHIIWKPSSSRFQISTHLNPTPMSLSQYPALNGMHSDWSQPLSLDKFLRLADSFSQSIQSISVYSCLPNILSFTNKALVAWVRFTVCLTYGWRSMVSKRSSVKPLWMMREAVGM